VKLDQCYVAHLGIKSPVVSEWWPGVSSDSVCDR